MKAITFTTDLGYKDHSAGVLKGKILSKSASVHFIDITHQVEPFDIQQGAHVLRTSWRSFPKGSIHVVMVGMENEEQHRCIFFESEGMYFVGPDNGLFPLALDHIPRDIHIPLNPSGLVNDVVNAVAAIANDNPLSAIGKATGNIRTLNAIIPPANDDLIKTSVVYIDVYGNVVCGLTQKEFTERRRDRRFSVEFGKRDLIDTVSRFYSDVPRGEKLCRFNDSGFLEIAIHKGNAHELLGLKLNDTILIEFS